jgi:hypothetical protein
MDDVASSDDRTDPGRRPSPSTGVNRADGPRFVDRFLGAIIDAGVNGRGAIAENGPGTMRGQHSFLEGGRRTSSLVAVPQCRVAWVPVESFDRSSLQELSSGHRREDPSAG